MPHIHEKIDFTATCYVCCRDKVLLRKHEKYGIWIGVGGHIELDEDPNEAVLREVKEEVGLDVELVSSKPDRGVLGLGPEGLGGPDMKELVPPEYLNIHNTSHDHRHVDLIYFAVCTSQEVIPEDENDEWHWFNKEELEMRRDELPHTGYGYAKKALEVCV